jgi:hypothetical protein
VEQRVVDLDDARLEVFVGGTGDLVIGNTHPSIPRVRPRRGPILGPTS